MNTTTQLQFTLIIESVKEHTANTYWMLNRPSWISSSRRSLTEVHAAKRGSSVVCQSSARLHRDVGPDPLSELAANEPFHPELLSSSPLPPPHHLPCL